MFFLFYLYNVAAGFYIVVDYCFGAICTSCFIFVISVRVLLNIRYHYWFSDKMFEISELKFRICVRVDMAFMRPMYRRNVTTLRTNNGFVKNSWWDIQSISVSSELSRDLEIEYIIHEPITIKTQLAITIGIITHVPLFGKHQILAYIVGVTWYTILMGSVSCQTISWISTQVRRSFLLRRLSREVNIIANVLRTIILFF